ncbi:MAG: molybdopterin-dependent oxidoreductase [Bacteroidales bacterium]|jgi:thiosulfate reductase/polysulfide reductase chain A|nr:molybdopterin-dependent oxidoreductase [Bacteroidales bacterium]
MATRRQFIKISAIGTGAVMAGAAGFRLLASEQGQGALMASAGDPLRRIPTYCEVCFWKCAGWIYKNEKGAIKKIIGNAEDLNCNGRLCPRGTGGIGMFYDENRLRTPLIRTEERGKQTFREATWEEAFDYIADKIKTISAEHGPECLALFTHGSGGKYFTNLLKALGSPHIAAPSYAQCRGPREVAFQATFGEAIESPERTDIRDTKCLVLIGSHIGENMHNGQVQEMSDAIDKGATIITVDPRFSTVAGKSKFWLPIKPATDLALLLAWINVIITEELYDKPYVEKYTYGFEYLKEHVKNNTPEWAYGITTIDPTVIRETAREMANASPAVIIHPGRHVTWYGDDTQRLRAVAILNALLGSWGRRGGFFSPESFELPEPQHPPYPEPKRSWRTEFPDLYKLADTVLANGVCDATIPDPSRHCQFQGWIVNGTNLIETLPNQANTLQAIQALQLLVVIDTMPMEITGWADVVLPECTYLERYDDIRVGPHRKPQIALRAPAAEPSYNTRPAYYMARELAKRLGVIEYFPFEKIEDQLDWQLKQVGSSLEEMMRLGVKTFERQYGDLYFQPGQDFEFYTPTGKIELYATTFADAGYDPMPKYTHHEEPPPGYYRLNYGRAPMHTFSRTSNNPNLTDLMEENTLWVNPRVAKEWALTSGQYIHLMNQDGKKSEFPIKVRVTERIRWDSVYMVHGFGHDQKKLERCYGKGASDTNLITKVLVDPIMGGTGMRGNFVTFLTETAGEEVAS